MPGPATLIAIARIAAPLVGTVVRRIQDREPDAPGSTKRDKALSILRPLVSMLLEERVDDDEVSDVLSTLIETDVTELHQADLVGVAVQNLEAAISSADASGSLWCQPTIRIAEARALALAARRALR
jgi:Na+-transporting NADH:ubiquinone oxidoreductase subunit NqrC